MRITMKQIAEMAHVSQPTVSRVINGNKNVNKEVAKRVLKVIDEVGYQPNKAAQTLKRNSSFLTGVSVINITNPYFMELVEALELEARQNGYNIILHNCNHNPVTEWENIQNFIARQVDAFIIVPISDNNLNKIKQLKIPTVVITLIKDSFDSVAISHRRGGQLAAEHFIKNGHTRFGYIGLKDDNKFEGFKGALYDNGITFNMDNFISLDSSPNNNYLIHKDIHKYLDKHKDISFTAVFTINDIAALEFIKVMNTIEKKVPEDIAVVGFDDTILAKSFSISSIRQPIKEMAKCAFKILLDRIRNNTIDEAVKIELEPDLIIRNSSNLLRE